MVDGALQVTERLMSLPKYGTRKYLFCRNCTVAEELCHQVKELQEEMDRPRRI